jgi:hypothetical protein
MKMPAVGAGNDVAIGLRLMKKKDFWAFGLYASSL